MQQDDPAGPLRRLAATTALAAQEYALGVEDGKVVLAAEVEETELFLAEARRTAAKLPAAERALAEAELDTAIALVARRGAPDSLAMRVGRLSSELAQRLGVTLDEIPAATPSLARGAEVYQASCAGCHGIAGRGDGPAGKGLDPAPANLADAGALRDVTPLDFYRRVTIGVAGTAMPAYEHTLPAADRWAVAVYASLLRLPAPASHADVPAALRPFAATAKLSDEALIDAVGGTDEREALARVAAVRSLQPDPATADAGPVFDQVRSRVDSAAALARAGQADEAGAAALDAYMTFEQVERDVRAKNGPLADELEAAFAALRTAAAAGAPAGEVNKARGELLAGLERAERTVAASLSPFNLFLQSFVLLLREGLEAILIVGALLTFLVKTGAGHRRRDVHLGIGGAIVASLLTAVLIETIFRISTAQQEALEGVTMLLATVVLFYVSYWLLSKMEVVKWTSFVKSRVAGAVTSGSSFALASAAFLAVYREGFETILFYKALFAAGGGSTLPVFAGMAAGTIVLVITYVAINRFGVKLPLRPFFAVTSAFLYYMAFVFAGQGVAELQEGGYLPTTVIGLAPRFPALGIYPTVETFAAQGVLVLLALVALVWVFLVEPRRLRVTSVMVPEPSADAQPAGVPAPGRAVASVPFSGELTRELLRSLERMEADLAEMRSEVERMKDHLVAAPREQSSRLH
jgi:high-affinity iron transporter